MGNLANIGMALGIGATIIASSVAGVATNDNKQLENDNKQLVVEVENAKEENSQLLDTNKLQETMIENLKTEKATLQTQVDTFTAEKGELNTQLATEQEKYNTLVAEKTELTNTYNALVESNNLTLEEKAELETQIAEKQNQIDEQATNITALNSTIAERDATILSLQNQISEISKQIDGFVITFYKSYYDVSFSSFGTSGCLSASYNDSPVTTDCNGQYVKALFSDIVNLELINVCKNDIYFASNEFTNAGFTVVSYPSISTHDFEVNVTFNGNVFDINLIDDMLNYSVSASVSFEKDESDSIIKTILNVDIVPVETQE